MATLLEKAQNVSVKKRLRRTNQELVERLELALAFIEGQITAIQVTSVLGCNRSNTYHNVGTILIDSYRAGLLKRTDK